MVGEDDVHRTKSAFPSHQEDSFLMLFLSSAAVYVCLADLKPQHCHSGYLAADVYHCRAMFICQVTKMMVTTVCVEENV